MVLEQNRKYFGYEWLIFAFPNHKKYVLRGVFFSKTNFFVELFKNPKTQYLQGVLAMAILSFEF